MILWHCTIIIIWKPGLKYPRSRAIYEQCNQLAEKITKLMQIVVVHVSVPGFVLPKAIYSYFVYFTTDLGVDAFVLPIPTWWVDFGPIRSSLTMPLINLLIKSLYSNFEFKISTARFPFDWKSPIAYLIAVLLQMRIVSVAFRYVAPFLSHGVTAALYSFSFVDDLKGDIDAIEESVQLKRSHENIYRQLSNFIQFAGTRRFDSKTFST